MIADVNKLDSVANGRWQLSEYLVSERGGYGKDAVQVEHDLLASLDMANYFGANPFSKDSPPENLAVFFS